MEIGFIGLGRMGSQMALNLIGKGHRLLVYDTNKDACNSAVKAGAREVSNPAEIARNVEFVISCVPGPREVAEVMTNPNGVLDGVVEGSLVIETSTIGPGQSCDLAQKFKEKGASYIDATVNRIVLDTVVEGKMTIMVGGDVEAFERAKPLLECLGDNIYHIGPTGSGNTVKVLNQMIFLSYVAVFSEGLALGEQLGVPKAKLLEVFSTSAAGHRMIMDKYTQFDADEEAPGFTINRVIKDLELANELCVGQNYPAPIFATALATFKQAAEQGLGSHDITALNRPLHDASLHD